MAAESARAIRPTDRYIRGSAAPASAGYAEPEPRQIEDPLIGEQTRVSEKTRIDTAVRSVPSVSLFAVFGAVLVGVLMVLVVLAQIDFNKVANDVVGLNNQYDALIEQQRKLEIKFESVIDMKEIERYARDVLGMSKPESDSIAIVYNESVDKVEIFQGSDEVSPLSGFGSFISSLLEHFTG